MNRAKIAINGFGRIGKCVFRSYLERFSVYGTKIEIVAINGGSYTMEDLIHAIKYDSVHGRCDLPFEIVYKDQIAILDNTKIKVFFEKDISLINWEQFGVDIVLDCTGSLVKEKKIHEHLKSKAKKVIVSAPYPNADITIVLGANEDALDISKHNIISIGSCTTNCLAPIAKVLNDMIGIESGFMTTVHAYTNDQSLLDSRHSDQRRSRAAGLSIIPSSTGAAKSIGLVIPQLEGKLDGSAFRVPTANVSIIDFKFLAKKQVSADEINEILRTRAAEIPELLAATSKNLVSCDFNHTTYSSIVDLSLTKVISDKFCRVAAWYDNEWGFSNRMLDIAVLLAGNL